MPASPTSLQTQVRKPLPGVVYAPPADLRRYLDAGVLTRETMPEAFRASFAQHASRLALRGSESEVTYAELDAITDRLGAAFLRMGLQPLDRVIFQLGNCNELVFGFIACLKAGLVPVCTLAAHRESEIGYLGKHAAARMHFVQGDDAKFDDVAFAERMRESIPGMQWTVQARGERRGKALHLRELVDAMPLEEARKMLAQVELDPFQVAVFQLSGGTTGVPKIIPRFHNEYIYNMRSVADFCGYGPDDCLFMPLPMMHNLNMGCCFGPFLLRGGTVAVATSLAPEAIGDIFKRCNPTWTVVAGPIAERLKPAIESGKLPLDKLRGVISANNAPVLRQLLKAPVRHIFGMTEGVIMLTSESDPQEVQDHMVGMPVSSHDQVKLYKIGSEEEITEEGVEGECAFSGPYTIHGYYDAAERNAQTFTSGGMYRSGDLMLFRDIGGKRYYQFRGRTKDVVDRAGEKVNSEEVEMMVGRHPAITATAIIGMPDKVYGERVCAFITLRDGMAAPTVADLGAFLQAQGLAKFKWPERIEVLPELPLTNAGKLSKPKLKEMIVQKLAAEKPVTA
ncbi:MULTISPECIES: AMP-binding protein [Polaromonas]|uniref:AMP-binding protein n=1 Tax=Polaromonas aquatica TaxID=332657 RepID=A0ABW1U3K2_9BURK